MPENKKCPFCAEEIQAAAIVCKHCHRDLTQSKPAETKAKRGCLTNALLIGAAIFGCLIMLGFFGAMMHPASNTVTTEQASSQKASAAPNAVDTGPYIGEPFKVGNLTYVIDSVDEHTHLGNEYTGKTADDGAVFVKIGFHVRNDGNETETVSSDSMKLSDGKHTFSPSAEGITALVMNGENKDFVLSQLQPGVNKKSITVFEMPKGTMVALEVPAGGFSSETKIVTLSTRSQSHPTTHHTKKNKHH